MKKTALLALILFAASPLIAQTWTGTTTTKAAIGTTTYENTKLTLRNIQYQTAPTPNQASSALKIMNGYDGANNNIMEIWNGTYQTFLGPNGSTVSYNPALVFWVSNRDQVGIRNSLRIGTTAATGAFANYKLSVDGDMVAKRCVVQVDNWADYVFEDSYALPTLADVEDYVNENKHLPGVPSGQEIKDKGLEVGEMNRILMQKVEELTLYVIRQQKEIDALKAAHAKP
ncbi:hypothetical protein [Taibaiella chishuiensis]|uniref:Endosialidase-like protein n=1 Tax=Taibaiella chishuiensis TaxID=1434707 RepID=A0A2P8DAH8_9BACT|nr:hypothetical protein [Taibaiella chishuiensis]PSK94213.1 hypothetical protein B0I18_101368 [Taibaiella chishuiensis]